MFTYANENDSIIIKSPGYKMATPTLDLFIEMTPDVMGGKLRIAGRRITVANIVIWHEWMGMDADEIATDYELTLTEIYAALAYYFNNRQKIDQTIRDSQAFIEEMKKKLPSKLPYKFNEFGN